MRVLIIKTSSMGDVIHTLPALTDAARAFPDITFDWVVEENFAEIPAWHPRVKNIIPVALRRWRKNLFSRKTLKEWQACRQLLRAESYDFIIDAQGLVKSAWLGYFARGLRCGFSWRSAREPLASLFYQKKVFAGKVKEVHAVNRMRRLFSQVLGYDEGDEMPDYGIDRRQFQKEQETKKYLVFLHGTTWPTKHWPEAYWTELAKIAVQQGWTVKLPWGNTHEHERAKRIAGASANIEILPRMNLRDIAGVLAGASALVAVDTGFGHLAAALDVPTVSLYGPTNPSLTGALGRSQVHLSAQFPCAPCLSKECTYREKLPVDPPCFSTLPPLLVWKTLETFF